MVLVVPDEEPDVSQEGLEEEGPRPKAQLDDSEASRAARKVDLDLDDAPFLEDEEEEEEAAEETPAPAPELPKPKKERKPLPPWVKNKFTLMGAGAGVLLIILALILFTGGEPAPEAPPAEETALPEVPEPEIPAEVEQDHLVRLDPFIIEQTDDMGELRFLEVRLIFTTPDGALADNLVRNTPTVRYALFYYLKNKDLTYLTDETNSEALKQELLAVANQYMADGRFENLLFEQYLVK